MSKQHNARINVQRTCVHTIEIKKTSRTFDVVKYNETRTRCINNIQKYIVNMLNINDEFQIHHVVQTTNEFHSQNAQFDVVDNVNKKIQTFKIEFNEIDVFNNDGVASRRERKSNAISNAQRNINTISSFKIETFVTSCCVFAIE